jgi:hypothetical protein
MLMGGMTVRSSSGLDGVTGLADLGKPAAPEAAGKVEGKVLVGQVEVGEDVSMEPHVLDVDTEENDSGNALPPPSKDDDGGKNDDDDGRMDEVDDDVGNKERGEEDGGGAIRGGKALLFTLLGREEPMGKVSGLGCKDDTDSATDTLLSKLESNTCEDDCKDFKSLWISCASSSLCVEASAMSKSLLCSQLDSCSLRDELNDRRADGKVTGDAGLLLVSARGEAVFRLTSVTGDPAFLLTSATGDPVLRVKSPVRLGEPGMREKSTERAMADWVSGEVVSLLEKGEGAWRGVL